jgi:putative transposase
MAYTIEARMRALEVASRCGSLREAARVTGISHETIRRWAAAGGRGRLAGVYTGHVVYGKEVDVTGVDERLPKGDEAPESGFEGTPEEQIRQLRLENDILRGMVEVLKGADLGHLTNREKTVLIEWLRRETDHPLRELTDSLRISKSSYEYQRGAIARGDKHAWLRPLVAEEFWAEDGARGYRVVTHRLRMREEPVVVSEKVVRAIMREDGLAVRRKARPKKYRSYAGETDERPKNIPLNDDGSHDFRADAPNEKWASDITEFKLPDAPKVYLSPVIDLFDGKPVGWAISGSPDAELANSSLLAACAQLRPGQHPFCHTDGGCHYRWPGWKGICASHGIARSMSRKGCSPDNAACEGFFGNLKNEFFYGRDWRGVSQDEFIEMLDGWLRRYSTDRIKYFKEEGGTVCDTIDGRRRRLGYAA